MAVSVVLGGFSDVRIKPHSGTVSAFARAQGGDNFILEASRDEIRNYVRHGSDLIVEFVDGKRLTIKDFFAQTIDYHNFVLESDSVQQLVDFAHALDGQTNQGGDGIEEAALVHRSVYAPDQASSSSDNGANIDQMVVSSVGEADKSDTSRLFSGKSFFSILGGVGAVAAVAEYAYGSRGNDGQDDFINPLDAMPMPDPMVPGPPEESEAGEDLSVADLRFFSTRAHLVETRIVNVNAASSLVFSMPLLMGGDVEDHPAHPFLYAQKQQGIYHLIANMSGQLNAGEKVQFRAGIDGQWVDGQYDESFNRWTLDDEQIAAWQNSGDLHWIESRVVDQNGEFLRAGSSLRPDEFYDNLPKTLRETLPTIAQIDYTQGADQKEFNPYAEASNPDLISIGGKVVGQFDTAMHKIQVRIDGGGWYDVTAIKSQGEMISWHYEDWPTYVSSDGDDEIMLLDDVRDTIFYRLLDDGDKAGGNGSDKIYNFTIGKWGEADVDRIDIAALLVDYDAVSPYLYSKIEGEDTKFYLYRHGTTDIVGDPPVLFTIMGEETSFQELYDNGQLILH